MQAILPRKVETLVASIQVLVIDDNPYMRRVLRTMLSNLGIKFISEAADGIAGLDAIRVQAPDIVLLDWEMPLLSGAELVKIVRAPGVFPVPDVPIIMLTGHGQRWRILEAARLGVNEFLCKPVSGKLLLERITAILLKPRAMVQLGEYYGPEPRNILCEPAETSDPEVRPPVAAAG